MEINDGVDKATTAKVLDEDCRIYLPESEKLMATEKMMQSSQLCIELNDLSYSASRSKSTGTNEKRILHNVKGYFEPGKVTVIIGPSGAGKTTLLKIISGERLSKVKGSVTVNGIERKREAFRKQLCYVPQQFDLLPFLTTKETLYIAARLKLSPGKKEQAIYLIVDEIVENLGLLDCLNTLASKLSGGERKRLSLGMEMITKPSVLLLDEPTSGLDSAASNQLISVLYDMAKANCTVICAVHQPSSQMISRFDNIMVLNRGRCMYCGPKSEILNVYSNAGFVCPPFYNIAEFVLEVITEQRNGDLENLYKVCCEEYEKFRSLNEYSRPNHEMNSLIASKQQSKEDNVLNVLANNVKRDLSTWQQQRVLFLRALIYIKRDNTMTKLRFAAHVVVALLLGIVFYNFGNDAHKVNSNIACLFFFLLFLFFANSMPAVQMFPTEAAVFLQEHLNNWYSLRSYYTVKILTDLPMQVGTAFLVTLIPMSREHCSSLDQGEKQFVIILCSSCFLFMSYYLTGQLMECDRIFKAWSVCVLITILGQTVGILTGAAFNTEIGTFLIPALSIPLLLFAGFFLKLGEMPVYLKPLSAISFFRYAFEGMMQAIYINRPNLPCSEIYCYLRSPKEILSIMDMPTMSFHVILIILGSWILCIHIIIYAILYWRTYYMKT